MPMLNDNTAKVAVRILRGEPAGSVIWFPQPTFWEFYRWPLAGAVSACLLQVGSCDAALRVHQMRIEAKQGKGTRVAGRIPVAEGTKR
jgi:hypothetical protein